MRSRDTNPKKIFVVNINYHFYVFIFFMTVLGNISPDSVISVCVVIAEKHLLYSISTNRSEQTNASKN